MGAFKIEITLHDDELIRFVQTALADDAHETIGPDATYVGRRIADEYPEVCEAAERLGS